MSKQIVVADASQLSCYDECEEKWHLQYNQNLVHIGADEDSPMDAGTYGHKLLEIYYGNIKRIGKAEAFKKAIQYNIHTHPEAINGQFPLTNDMIGRIRERFTNYYLHYSVIGDFDVCYHKKLTIRSDGNYGLLDAIEDQPLIEQGFSTAILDTSEYLFVLEGKIDMIAQTVMGTAFIDNKWQFRERDLYTKSIQFKSYAMATGLKIGIINYIRMKKNFDATTLQRQCIAFNSQELKYWKEECIEMFHRMAKSLRSHNFIHRWSACDGKYGYKCEYAPICEEYNPRIKNAVVSTNYKKRKEWKPW
jgi:PD-(D/E)XK nuclease superfamily